MSSILNFYVDQWLDSVQILRILSYELKLIIIKKSITENKRKNVSKNNTVPNFHSVSNHVE